MLPERYPVCSSCIFAELGTHSVRQKIEQKANCICCSCHCCKASLHVTAAIGAKKCRLKGDCYIWSGCRQGLTLRTVRKGITLTSRVDSRPRQPFLEAYNAPFRKMEGIAISSMAFQPTVTCDIRVVPACCGLERQYSNSAPAPKPGRPYNFNSCDMSSSTRGFQVRLLNAQKVQLADFLLIQYCLP